MGRHYLDHASTSPLRPEARSAVLDALDRVVGDPGRIHHEGMTARALLEDARDRVAAAFGARSREVVFTSGATESVTAAVVGCSATLDGPGPGGRRPIVCPPVEHSAVRLAAERAGPVVTVAVDRSGRVDAAQLLAVVDDLVAAGTPPALVCCQWGNHEVGTTQPVAEVVAGCRERRVPVLVDAAQAAGREPIDFAGVGADLLAVSGHKLGGPTGTGALLIRRGVRIPPLFVGGDQERARRAGLENTVGALGLAAAAEVATASLPKARADAERWSATLRAVLGGIAGVEVFGHPVHRLAHLVCAGIADIEPQAVLLGLDRAGIAAHSGSACASEGLEPSPVLEAMGVDADRSLRLSVGWCTTDADVDAVARALPGIVADLRALRA
jgi:cysteine desulfurase